MNKFLKCCLFVYLVSKLVYVTVKFLIQSPYILVLRWYVLMLVNGDKERYYELVKSSMLEVATAEQAERKSRSIARAERKRNNGVSQ